MILRCVCVLFLILITAQVDCRQYDGEELIFFWKKSKAHCEPFSTYAVACNMCVCGADGVPSCTKNNCSNTQTEKMVSNEVERMISKTRKSRRKKRFRSPH